MANSPATTGKNALHRVIKESLAVAEDAVSARTVLFGERFGRRVQGAYEEISKTSSKIAASIRAAKTSALSAYGLTKKQLAMKMEAFDTALDRFRENGGIAHLKEFLAQAITLLGSIASALSQPLVEALKEFLETILNFINGNPAHAR